MEQDFESKSDIRSYLFYVIIFVAILIVGAITGTYAYFKVAVDDSMSSPVNIIGRTDCINVTFDDGGTQRKFLTLDVDYPVSDEWALGTNGDGEKKPNITPVKITVKNNCTNSQADLNYTLAITTLGNSNSISDDKIRTHIKKSVGESSTTTVLKNTDYLNKLTKIEENSSNYKLITEDLQKKEEIEYTNYPTVTSYQIDIGKVKSNSSNTYEIYLWIDYYEGDSAAYQNNGATHNSSDNQYDNSTKNKNFNSIITLLVNTDIAEDASSQGPQSGGVFS